MSSVASLLVFFILAWGHMHMRGATFHLKVEEKQVCY